MKKRSRAGFSADEAALGVADAVPVDGSRAHGPRRVGAGGAGRGTSEPVRESHGLPPCAPEEVGEEITHYCEALRERSRGPSRAASRASSRKRPDSRPPCVVRYVAVGWRALRGGRTKPLAGYGPHPNPSIPSHPLHRLRGTVFLLLLRHNC
ncbi:uncharacterized protein A4U43_C08F8920 [Asparagus officinalis]|nr:uncharacterized protein A4U43_C08F8920 [Asparagus officinalis]